MLFWMAAVFCLFLRPSLVTGSPIASADHLRGYRVQSADGVVLGSVAEIFFDLENGKIGYLSVSTEGERPVIVPWRAAHIRTGDQSIRLFIDPRRFQEAPFVQMTEMDHERGRALHRYFGVAPYWEDDTPSAPRPPRNLRIVK
jgi:sporulation protein YlmC with PRC-barrel domain